MGAGADKWEKTGFIAYLLLMESEQKRYKKGVFELNPAVIQSFIEMTWLGGRNGIQLFHDLYEYNFVKVRPDG